MTKSALEAFSAMSDGEAAFLASVIECYLVEGLDWSSLFREAEAIKKDAAERALRLVQQKGREPSENKKTEWEEKEKAYAVLGLRRGVSKEEIDAAYRELASQYHPDRLPSGATQKMRELIEEKMKEINLAYHEIRK